MGPSHSLNPRFPFASLMGKMVDSVTTFHHGGIP